VRIKFPADPNPVIDLADNTKSFGTGWTFDSTAKTYTITDSKTYKVINSNALTGHRLAVNGGVTATLVLSNMSIDVSNDAASADAAAIALTSGANVTLSLVGTNMIKNGATAHEVSPIYVP